jgi:hypothetical protein
VDSRSGCRALSRAGVILPKQKGATLLTDPSQGLG